MRCVGVEQRGTTETLRALDEDEKSTLRITEGIQRGNPNMNVISESGLYSLIFRSRKEEAKRFRKWVTGEVLPSLRKHGRYGTEAAVPLALAPGEGALRIKASMRAQALHSAVQTARLDNGSEADVKRLYGEFCDLFAARPAKQQEIGDDPCAELVSAFVEEALVVTDITHGTMPRQLKTQMKDIYTLFSTWCEEVRGLRSSEVPSMNLVGRSMRQFPHVHRVSPINKVFYNVRPA